MGLLDQLGGLLGGEDANISQILKWSEQEGGVSGLLEKIRQGGLSDVVQSWVGSGNNLPISAEQIQQVLGNETIQKLASSIGVDTAQASEFLSKNLPDIINQLTPDGNESSLTDTSSLLSSGLDFLKNKLG